jgi:outer membrane immunogenic protein
MTRFLSARLGAVALASTIGLATLAVTASAADLPPAPQEYYKAPPYAPAFTWSGFYIGINGGGEFGWSHWDGVGGFDTSGGLVGGTVGYNYQSGPAVFGIEGDIDWSSLTGTTTNPGCPAGCTTSNSWLSTVRGRVGYAAGRFMPYITGGGAFGNINASTPGLAGGSATNAGWTIGAGLEFAIAGHWTAKAEYLYVDLGRFNCGAGCGAPFDNVSFNENIIRGGVNFRF